MFSRHTLGWVTKSAMAIGLLLIYGNVEERVLYSYIFVVKALDDGGVCHGDDGVYRANQNRVCRLWTSAKPLTLELGILRPHS
jgi:hypothetical protein